jgi:hypothetical protein
VWEKSSKEPNSKLKYYFSHINKSEINRESNSSLNNQIEDNNSLEIAAVKLENLISNKQSKKRSCTSPLNEKDSKKDKMSKIDPILIINNGSSQFNRSNFIEFDNKITSTTNAGIKFTMLDKKGNLLIFPKTTSDADKIMKCDQLFNGCKKIDLGKKDNRPKAVIIGLTYELANLYIDWLKNYGIIEVINLSRTEKVNIVKVVFEKTEDCANLVASGSVEIESSSFKVCEDRRKNNSNNKKKKTPKKSDFNSEEQDVSLESDQEIDQKIEAKFKENVSDKIDNSVQMKMDAFFEKFESKLANSMINSNLNLETRFLEVMQINNKNIVDSIAKHLNSIVYQNQLDENQFSSLILNDCNPVLINAINKNKADLSKIKK